MNFDESWVSEVMISLQRGMIAEAVRRRHWLFRASSLVDLKLGRAEIRLLDTGEFCCVTFPTCWKILQTDTISQHGKDVGDSGITFADSNDATGCGRVDFEVDEKFKARYAPSEDSADVSTVDESPERGRLRSR